MASQQMPKRPRSVEDDSMFVEAPNHTIFQKKIRIDIPGGSMRHVANMSTTTAPGQYNLTSNTDQNTNITLNVYNTSGTNTSGVLQVKGNEVHFDVEATVFGLGVHANYALEGAVKAAADPANFTSSLFVSGSTAEMPEGTTTTVSSLLNIATDVRKQRITRIVPKVNATAYSANDQVKYWQPAFLANDTRMKPFKSITMQFNNNSTILKIVDPDINYSQSNAFFGQKTTKSDSCGEVSICTPQFRRGDSNFARSEMIPETNQLADDRKHFRIMEELCPAYGDARRFAAGEWFEGAKIGHKLTMILPLGDIFPAFRKDELMYMPSFVLSMELNDLFREYFLTVIPPVITATTTTAKVTYPAEVLPPLAADFSDAVVGSMSSSDLSSASYTDVAAYTVNKVYMSITRLVYRAETYASPLTPTPLPFTSPFTAFDIIKYTPKDTDKTQRITFSVTRDPVCAVIYFKANKNEYYPFTNGAAPATADAKHWFNNRWWPNNRQITRVSATRDGIELAGVNNDFLQWAPTSNKRLNRERMIREARILAGENSRGQNNMFALDSDEFVRCPYYIVKLDNIIRDPGTYAPSLTEERSTSSEYTLSIEFDGIDSAALASTLVDGEADFGNVISKNMLLHEIHVMLIQQHTFVSNVNTVVSTKKN